MLCILLAEINSNFDKRKELIYIYKVIDWLIVSYPGHVVLLPRPTYCWISIFHVFAVYAEQNFNFLPFLCNISIPFYSILFCLGIPFYITISPKNYIEANLSYKNSIFSYFYLRTQSKILNIESKQTAFLRIVMYCIMSPEVSKFEVDFAPSLWGQYLRYVSRGQIIWVTPRYLRYLGVTRNFAKFRGAVHL
jgi:hypothetical protein